MDTRLFRTVYNTYLGHQNGHLVALPYVDQTSQFHLERHGDKVALRTHHFHFVGVNHQHAVYLTNHAHDSQKFHIERFPDGRIALRSSHGTYLCVHPNGSVTAHHRVESGEFFTEEMPQAGYVQQQIVPTAPPGYPGYAAAPVYTPPPQQVVYQPPQQQVVYQQPQQVVYQQPPPVVYQQAPQVVYTPPVVVQQPTVIVRPGPSVLGVGLGVGLGLGLGFGHRHHGHHHHHHHGHHHR